MKVLLVKPWSDSFNWYHSHMLGIAYLGGYLRQAGHAVRILDAAFSRWKANALLAELTRGEADVVGITAMTHEMPRARLIASAARAASPAVRIVLGGPHASSRPAETLREVPALDFVIAGEGERPFSRLLERLDGGRRDFTGIEGLAYRDGKEVLFDGPQTTFLDLASIPQPAVDLYYPRGFFSSHPQSEYRIMASRGCPFHCAYCQRVLGRRTRWRDPDAVVQEWITAVDYYGARDVFFHDELFLYDHPNTHRILDGAIAAGIHTRARFHAMTHPTLVDDAVLRRAAEANCFKVCVGVESGNDDVLRRVHRNYTVAEAARAVGRIKAAGLHPFTFFILGHPGETRRTVLDTLAAAVRMNPHEIGLGVMVPYPGTEIFDLAKAGKGGYRLTDADWDAYDRYGGRALEFTGFSHRELVCYQVLGYLAFFLLNGKLAGMYRYFRPKLRAAARVVVGRRLS